jgi:hypothetical protein
VHAQRKREHQSLQTDELLAHALNKIAAVLLRLGFNAPRAEKLLRAAFVQAAETYARTHGVRVNQSKIATLAGVNRIDVRRLLEVPSKDRAPAATPRNRLEAVVSGWRDDPKFCNRRGQPRVLSCKGKNSEFSRLVKKYGRDVTTKSILEQLLRLGSVTEKPAGFVQLRRPSAKSAEMEAAQADLKFLESQLGKLSLQLGRRAYVTRSTSVPVRSQQTAGRLQRTTLEKIRLMLGALDGISHREKRQRPDQGYRVIVTATVAIESGRVPDGKRS